MRLLVCSLAMVAATSAFAAKLDPALLERIVVPADAIPSERYAAEEFQRLFGACCGVDLPIAEGDPDQKHTVYIGPRDDLGEEGLRIRIRKDRVTITGGRPRGPLYGVYEFFERYFDVRFLTHDHTYTPRLAPGAKIRSGTHTYRPEFSFRWSYYGMNARHP